MRSKNFLAAATIAIIGLSAGVVNAQMKAHFINVGQAESILLEFRRHAVLIDAGGEDTGDTRDRDHLLDYLDRFFARRTDLRDTLHSVVVSHPHIDHTRHLMDVLENYTVRNLSALTPSASSRSSGYSIVSCCITTTLLF